MGRASSAVIAAPPVTRPACAGVPPMPNDVDGQRSRRHLLAEADEEIRHVGEQEILG